ILFGDIPTVIPSTSVIAPETFVIDSDSDSPDEMDSPEYITPLPATHHSYTPILLRLLILLMDHYRRTLMLLPLLVGGAGFFASSFLSLDAPGQAHSGSSTRVVSPRLGYPLVRAPRHSEAFRHWCAAPLSTFYPPTTSESSSKDSSERPLHSSLHYARPSRKRCRSLTDSVPSFTPPRKSDHIEVDPRDDRIVRIENMQRQLKADQMIASGARASMAESIRSLRLENLKVWI
nr:hypothetical protein [Tanacetum cinerariifolium]